RKNSGKIVIVSKTITCSNPEVHRGDPFRSDDSRHPACEGKTAQRESGFLHLCRRLSRWAFRHYPERLLPFLTPHHRSPRLRSLSSETCRRSRPLLEEVPSLISPVPRQQAFLPLKSNLFRAA